MDEPILRDVSCSKFNENKCTFREHEHYYSVRTEFVYLFRDFYKDITLPFRIYELNYNKFACWTHIMHTSIEWVNYKNGRQYIWVGFGSDIS